MGVWGTKLYSGDFAMDLRSTIGAVARLPFDPERLAEIVAETEPGAANRPDDSDHTTFWLVLADQFAKKGIRSARARDKALQIIDSGSDLDGLKKLGMDDTGLRQRAKVLQEVRSRIAAPVDAKPRTVIRQPLPMLMDVGDVFLYPTFHGNNINPYFRSKELVKHVVNGAVLPWKQDGWSAFVVVYAGRAFGFLPWYRPVTITNAVAEKPSLTDLQAERPWILARAGTCTTLRMKRLELEKLARLPVDPEKVRQAFPGLKPGIVAAVSDICICNGLHVGPTGLPLQFSKLRPDQTIASIGQLLASD